MAEAYPEVRRIFNRVFLVGEQYTHSPTGLRCYVEVPDKHHQVHVMVRFYGKRVYPCYPPSLR